MSGYLAYLAKRLLQFVLVVFIGINLAYVITHATPIDPVEQSISAVTSFGNTAPDAIEQMRHSLRELYGLDRHALRAISRVLEADPASPISGRRCRLSRRRSSTLIGRALPWTIGLLVGVDHRCLGARQPAGRACRLLPARAAA